MKTKRGRYPGVYWHPQLQRWVVQITVLVGVYDDQDVAGAVQARVERHREHILKMVRRVAGADGEIWDDPVV